MATLSYPKFLAVTAAIVAPLASVAQSPQDQPVAERKRDQYQASGLRSGAFVIFPSIALKYLHDDNIFADQNDTIDDTIREIKPAIEIESDWAQHALRIRASAALGRYLDLGAEDYDDVEVVADGRIDVTRGNKIRLSARHASLHQDRFSPDDADGVMPTEFDSNMIGANYERSAGRRSLEVGISLRNLDYDDVAALAGRIDNDDRDRDELVGTARLAFPRTDASELFVHAEIDSRDYDQELDDMGLARSSERYGIAVGAAFKAEGPISWDGFVGYARRDYDDARLSSIDLIWFGGELAWNFTSLTTLTAQVKSSIEETTLANAAGISATELGFSLDHELRRNIFLNFGTYYRRDKYQDIDRDDDVSRVGVGFEYYVNRQLSLSMEYAWRRRDSTQTPERGDDYDINTLSLQLTGRL